MILEDTEDDLTVAVEKEAEDVTPEIEDSVFAAAAAAENEDVSGRASENRELLVLYFRIVQSTPIHCLLL